MQDKQTHALEACRPLSFPQEKKNEQEAHEKTHSKTTKSYELF